MKTLVKKESGSYCSEYVEHNKHKFRIVCENGNSYSRLRVSAMTSSGDFALIAEERDIPDYEFINYASPDRCRLMQGQDNIRAAKRFIMKLYKEENV